TWRRSESLKPGQFGRASGEITPGQRIEAALAHQGAIDEQIQLSSHRRAEYCSRPDRKARGKITMSDYGSSERTKKGASSLAPFFVTQASLLAPGFCAPYLPMDIWLPVV